MHERAKSPGLSRLERRLKARVAANIDALVRADGRRPPEVAAAAWPDRSEAARVRLLQRLRRGQVWPTPESAAPLARALGVDVGAFFAYRQ